MHSPGAETSPVVEAPGDHLMRTLERWTPVTGFATLRLVNQQDQIPVNVVIGRIASIVGLSICVAFGILLLLSGTYWIAGLVSFLLALPFAALLRLVEYRAERGRLRSS
jgi:hypothetical protein